MKSKTYLFMIVLIVLVGGAFIFVNGNSGNSNVGNAVANGGDVQEVTLGLKNYNYYPQVVKVKVNQPVRIYLDESVVGCYRSFTVREFGVSKNLRTPQDYVEFTPNKKGTFGFSCSMGMGTGTLIVE